MSVINTNITSMIGQSNLQKSQNALQTSMERLSSGLRINSAKDDAAGQAIANRMTSQITGLMQAQRNANDGISVAQTAEGALNQVNDNLQRIRELSVQAQNETNSSDDLKSIQDEIGQRLSEIDRISKETSFNGVDVLASDRALQIQVGANDGEKIEVNLKEINAQTLGLSTFNVDGLRSSQLSDALIEAGQADVMQAVNVLANSYDAGTGPNSPVVEVDELYTTSVGSGFAVKGDDGNYYELEFNATTEKWVWDSSAGALNEGDVNVSDGPVTDLPVYQTFDATAATWDDGSGGAGSAVTENGVPATGFSIDYSAGLFQRNDITNDPSSGTGLFAVEGSDGNYYEITATYTFNGAPGQEDDPSQYTVAFDIDLDPANLVQISSSNISGNVSQIAVGEYTVSPEEDLFNEDLTAVPTATGDVFALANGGDNEFAVAGSDGKYYLGTFDPTTGDISWNSSAGALDPADVDIAGGVIEEVAVDTVQGNYTGLASGETLHSYTDSNGDLAYVVKSGSGNDAIYTKATLGAVDPVTGDIEIIKETGDDATLSVRSTDPLAALDAALNQVDSLRSELGAVQNRFEDAITNLNTNATNLSAARSRIEDADYAMEVANMTRAQILQQAGTSVLAQANQIPQNVLSLLG